MFPGKPLIICSTQIQRGAGLEDLTTWIAAGRQKVDTRGVVVGDLLKDLEALSSNVYPTIGGWSIWKARSILLSYCLA